MKDSDGFFKALATAFVVAVGLMLWIGAIASIFISCASHKERVSIHTSDSISIVQEHTAQSSSFESMILRNFSIDSIILSEKLFIPDSAHPETAHGSQRTIIIHGFRANTIEESKETKESESKREAVKQHHQSDSTHLSSETQTVGASLISPFYGYCIISVLLIVVFFLIRWYKCKIKK